MNQLDLFTQKRILRFIESHRKTEGILPTLQTFEKAGFDRKVISQAVRENLLTQLYVTLTNGTTVKGYCAAPDSRIIP